LVADSPAWKRRREKYPDFFKDPRNIVLLGCADGATVWKDLRGVFPVTFQYLNLHPAIRGKFVNMELWGVCNGTKPKSTQPIYELFVDQLLELWEGVPCYDVLEKKSFNLRCMLFKMLFDIKGLMDGACRMDVGAYSACLKCMHRAWHSNVFNGMRYTFRTESDPGECHCPFLWWNTGQCTCTHCVLCMGAIVPNLYVFGRAYHVRLHPVCTKPSLH